MLGDLVRLNPVTVSGCQQGATYYQHNGSISAGQSAGRLWREGTRSDTSARWLVAEPQPAAQPGHLPTVFTKVLSSAQLSTSGQVT